MKWKNRFKKIPRYITGLMLLHVFFIILLIKNQDLSLKRIRLYDNFNKQIYIVSKNQELLSPLPDWEYPYVRTALWSNKYPLVVLNENVNLWNGNYDRIFFASKRISELIKWGQEMKILKNIYTLDQLKKWWVYSKPLFYEINKARDYASWEAELARYETLIEDEIISIPHNNLRTIRLLQIRDHLRKDDNNLERAIYYLKTSADNKQYLKNLKFKIFNYLDNLIPIKSDYPELSSIQYPLTNIQENKEYGIYNITIGTGAKTKYYKELTSLKLGNKQIQPTKLTENNLVYNKIAINPNDNELTITVPRINYLANESWNTKDGKYFMSVPSENINPAYLLHISYKLSQPTNFFLEENYKDIAYKSGFNKINILSFARWIWNTLRIGRKSLNNIDTNYEEIAVSKLLLDQFLEPTSKNKTITRLIRFHDDKEITSIQINLSSEKPLSTDDIKNVRVEMITVFMPELKIHKIANLPDRIPNINYWKIKNNLYRLILTNTNSSEDKLITDSLGFGWTPINKEVINDRTYYLTIEYTFNKILLVYLLMSLLIIFILGMNLVFHPNYRKYAWFDILIRFRENIKHGFIYFYKYIVAISSSIKKKVVQFRRLLLIMSIAGIFINVVILPVKSDALILSIISLWILTTVGYKNGGRFHMLAVLISIGLTLCLKLIGFESAAEMLSIWAYLFMIISAVYLMI